MHPTEVRVGPGAEVGGRAPSLTAGRRRPRVAELAGVELHGRVGERIGDPGRRGARCPARGDRMPPLLTGRVEVVERDRLALLDRRDLALRLQIPGAVLEAADRYG